ncbi:hypothetical protein K501DRAFT_288111 [Backusella circina FSU 941]|nr:hypothetical protein K501DRAFT_288111 [Backusella circina FSU 941]
MSFIPRTFQRFSKLATVAKPRTASRFTQQACHVRFVHSSPKEYTGVQSAAYHFKRQRHMPYFLEYLMWVVFGSEALHLIWLKMEYKEYKERIQHKTKLLEELIERIENGEKITSGMKEEIKMVLMNRHTEATAGDDDIDDDYLDKLIANSEIQNKGSITESKAVKSTEEESKWMEIEDDKSAQVAEKKPFFL